MLITAKPLLLSAYVFFYSDFTQVGKFLCMLNVENFVEYVKPLYKD